MSSCFKINQYSIQSNFLLLEIHWMYFCNRTMPAMLPFHKINIGSPETIYISKYICDKMDKVRAML